MRVDGLADVEGSPTATSVSGCHRLASPGVVLFASHSAAVGGAEHILIEFATALDTEVCLACPEGNLASVARANGIRVFPLRARRPNIRASSRDRILGTARLAAHALELRRLIRSVDPEAVVACGMRPAIACLLGPQIGRPVVFDHNDLLPGPLIARLVRAAAAHAALITMCSRTVAEDLDPSGTLGNRLRVVHPGVDVDRFDRDAPAAEPPEVIVLGALTPWKRPDLALEACALARRERPDLRLRMVGTSFAGDGDALLLALRARASEPDLAGSVEFAGAVADPRTDLSRASCLLHCASREPFGIVVVEALAAGRPAVVPAAAGPLEIVDESCGLLYQPGDARGAADAILHLLSDPQRAAEMGAAGRARARARFERESARARYAAAVAPLLPHARGRESVPVALLTVSHNSGGHLKRLLASAERHLPGARVVVVDSASSDDSLEIARAHQNVTAVALERNVGFGRACNRGLGEIDEAVVALVNPDVELLDDSLLALAAEAMDEQRLLAPLVLTPDGSRQDSVHPLPTSTADLARSLVPPGALPGRLGLALAPWRATRPRRVGWAVGCAIVARTDTLRRLGPFDERIFMYGEDLELGLRAAAMGVQTWFWPAARVLHHGAHSSLAAFGGEPFDLLARARHDVVARRLGLRRAALDDAAQAFTFASRALLKRALGRSAARERQQLAALGAVRRADGRR
jgi:N-acetylglucosaminyl-diphospho-decaprenol L-rhamnosyltransferase